MLCAGTSPLLMHNGRLVDPLDTITKKIKEVSSKRVKTDEDHEEMAKLEWLGGIYFDPSAGPFIPALNLLKCLIEGARLNKGGKQIERGVFFDTIMIPLVYDGPRELETLYVTAGFRHRVPVTIGRVKVMRTRPIFNQWRLHAEGMFDGSVVNFANLHNAARLAGQMIGLCDGRPLYGRFHCELREGTP
jgi:hypothetical protein